MTAAEIKAIKNKVRRYVKSFGLSKEEVEDLSQDVLERLLVKQWRQPVQFAVIDLRRIKFGRKGEKKLVEEELRELKEISEKENTNRIELEDAIKHLEPMDRVMVLLRCVWGFELKEIAYLFNMSATGVMQRMNNQIMGTPTRRDK